MTIRRWKSKANKELLPRAYERSVIEGIYQLLIDGLLSSESETVRDALSASTTLSFQAALKELGVAKDVIESNSTQEDKVTIALCQIGASEKRKGEVEASKPKLNSLKKMGQEWTRRISILMEVIQSGKLSALDKLVAYGALFYLICPFDLIPDQIPVIGYIDDFGILGFAVAYYIKQFPKIFG